MKKIYSGLKNPMLSFLLIFVVVLSLSCTLPTLSPSPTPASAQSSTETASPAATPAQITPTAPPSTGSPIDPGWTPPPLSEDALPADLSGIVEQVLPWVVSINVEISSTSIFGQTDVQQGAGSGWIIDSDGLIVTNNHVIEDAQSVSISLNDGRVFQAEQIAADPVSDLAVVKIDASGLPVATVGDSSKLKPGMMVMAVGNALGEGISMTAGWVSRIGVSISVPASGTASTETLFGLIQTSAPINPGNSGGPLVDMLGEVVGITNVKLVASGVENVGYAISTNAAMPLIQELIQTGQIVRPYLGVSMRTVTPDIASMLNLSVTEGALVIAVDPNSPAAGAGLQQGDVVVKSTTGYCQRRDAVEVSVPVKSDSSCHNLLSRRYPVHS